MNVDEIINIDDMMNQIDWNEIGISDDFMFGKVMEKPELCGKLLETILGIEIEKIEYPERQKAIDIAKESRGIRLDVYVAGDDAVYNIEMQAQDTRELPKRARYYRGLIDLNLIEKGASYNNLNRSFIIFICTFDGFGKARHRYTFENMCLEEKDLPLCDGTTKIFLNAKGTMNDVSPELKAFLDYVAGKKSDDGFVKEVDEEVKRVRKNTKWRRDYMTLLMRDREKYEQGRKEGHREGREEGRKEGREEGRTEGRTEGKLEIVVQLIRNGLLTVREGAEQLHMTEADITKYL